MEDTNEKEENWLDTNFFKFANLIYIHVAAGNLIFQRSAHNKFRNRKY
jgi:hypothetical protein